MRNIPSYVNTTVENLIDYNDMTPEEALQEILSDIDDHVEVAHDQWNPTHATPEVVSQCIRSICNVRLMEIYKGGK